MKCSNIKQIRLGSLLGCVLLVGGCSSNETKQSATESATASIVAGQSPSEASKAKMLAAKEALFTRLSERLNQAMTSQGPAAAISVCKQEAPQIAQAIGDERGLKIGRTGVRLRNANNVAPMWAEELVRNRVDTPTFVTLDNGHSAALLPIKLQGQCLMCHGHAEQIAPIIREQLTKLYPNDQATGFKEGELRGWFWIDLPNS